MASGRRIRRSVQAWEQLIAEQRGSGQSRRAFCQARGLHPSTFYAWQRRLYGTGGAPAPTAQPARVPSKAVAALFTPLTRPMADAGSASRDAVDWTVELELGNGLCLRLRRGA